MIVRTNQQRSLRPIYSRPSLANNYDQFYLTRILAQRDPLLQRINSIASLVLDDHPYPKSRKEFNRRTIEIEKNIQNLKLSSSSQRFLRRLMDETGVNVVDLWQGSHIIALDDGDLYSLWSKSRKARPRFSSHYSNVPIQQYGINFKDHQLLFGKTSRKGSTWFQMEAHGFDPNDIMDDPNLALYHGQDFLKYRFHGMNVGPCGLSPHTETMHPIKLPYRPLNINSTTQLLTQKRPLPLNTRTRLR